MRSTIAHEWGIGASSSGHPRIDLTPGTINITM